MGSGSSRGADAVKKEVEQAILGGHVEAVSALVEGGVPMDGVPGYGTLLQCAIAHSKVEVVRWLLSQGAQPDVIGGADHLSPLCKAISNGSTSIVELLLRAGACPDGVACSNGSAGSATPPTWAAVPLHAVARYMGMAVAEVDVCCQQVQQLLEAGAAVDITAGMMGSRRW